jgi:hypothetical protein
VIYNWLTGEHVNRLENRTWQKYIHGGLRQYEYTLTSFVVRGNYILCTTGGSARQDNSLRLWHWPSATLQHTLHIGDPISTLAITSDHTHIIAGTVYGRIFWFRLNPALSHLIQF